ncbi:hypothetical protein BTHE68_41090 [Burkholderia sp. THE68]|nr:hypothetical protein BTHE68_41090 [Burkholderia sp. THE68]
MNVPGWGPKTSALFVKCVIKLHRSKCDDSHFLEEADAAEIFGKDDRVFLPVDAVIKRISQAIPAAGLGTSFDSMNARLCAAGFIAEDMLVWDDLWFWGFLTQNSSTKERVMAWNEPRFWGQLSMPKSKIDEIKRECETFLALLVP